MPGRCRAWTGAHQSPPTSRVLSLHQLRPVRSKSQTSGMETWDLASQRVGTPPALNASSSIRCRSASAPTQSRSVLRSISQHAPSEESCAASCRNWPSLRPTFRPSGVPSDPQASTRISRERSTTHLLPARLLPTDCRSRGRLSSGCDRRCTCRIESSQSTASICSREKAHSKPLAPTHSRPDDSRPR